MKKLLCWAALLLMLLCGCGENAPAAEATPTPAPTPIATPAPTLPPETTYHHSTQGWEITVDSHWTWDETVSAVGTVFHGDGLTVEIYEQAPANVTFDNYAGYSNVFLRNTADHTTLFTGTRTVGQWDAAVTQWQREALPMAEDDRCHYLTYDINAGHAYYSIHVKSAAPITDTAPFDAMAASFRITDAPSAQAVTLTPQPWHAAEVDPAQRDWNEETAAYYAALCQNSGLQWGIFEPGTVKGDWDTLATREVQLDYSFGTLLCYSHFYRDPADNPYTPIGQLLQQAWERGKVVELTLQMNTSADGSNNVYDILRGEYDPYLIQYAQAVAEFGHPVLFRLNNEMNGDWCPYSAFHTGRDAAVYNEVYRYIHGIFEDYGANRNALWVWNPNEQSFPNFTWNHTLLYYPGDEYVDVIGLTAYNTGTYYASVGESWQSFDTLYRDVYDQYCAWFSRPFMITEFACASMGGDKQAWVEDMFTRIKDYDRIKIAVWWNHRDYDNGVVSRSYVLDETPALVEVFRNRLAEFK